MPTLSPLSTLVETLTQVSQNAQRNEHLLAKNEAATRAALIDPVLRALGWDTTNVQIVEPEKTINTTWRADYALHNSTGKIELLIEAKCLGSNLEKYSVVQQLLSYAFGFGVLKLAVTDGVNWHFYSDFKPGSTLADNHFNLLRDNVTDCALLLISWLDTIRFGHGITNSLPIPSNDSASLVLSDTVKQPKSAVKEPTKSTKFNSAVSYHKLAADLANADSGLGKPTWLRLPDGTEHQLKSWRDILVKAAELVLLTRSDLSLPLPDKAGKKTSLIRWERPAASLAHESTLYQGKPAFIYTNYSAAACIMNALHLLKLIPKKLQLVEAGVAFKS
jgi:hypothetical protein